MKRTSVIPLAVITVTLLAGCSSPFGPSQETTSPTDTQTLTDTGTPETQPPEETPPSPTATPPSPTPTPPSPTPTPPSITYPPGVTETGLHNVTALLAGHTETLTEPGYAAVGRGNTTVVRRGILVNVTSRGLVTVEPNASAYQEMRLDQGGPVTRRTERWSNGSVEFQREQESGDTTYQRNDPQSPEELASSRLLGPFLRGGVYELVETNSSGDETLFTLRATEYDNEKALKRGLPEDTTSVRWYNSTMVVDQRGRIRSFTARVGFVIGGENRVHRLNYEIEKIGNVSVERPEWVDEAG